jgi:hypothetical protein
MHLKTFKKLKLINQQASPLGGLDGIVFDAIRVRERKELLCE